MDLKPLPAEGIPAAIEKAKQYRLLNEPSSAESICRDILRTDPENHAAKVILVLAMADHCGQGYSVSEHGIKDALAMFDDEYERAYFTGIAAERRGLARIRSQSPGSSSMAYYCLTEAMSCFEAAEKLSPPSNSDATLRWNTCARLIERNKLEPYPEERTVLLDD